MRVLVAGATGAIGKQLVPRLVAAGHDVHGMTRGGSKQMMLYEMGTVPVVADALDPDQVAQVVGRASPHRARSGYNVASCGGQRRPGSALSR